MYLFTASEVVDDRNGNTCTVAARRSRAWESGPNEALSWWGEGRRALVNGYKKLLLLLFAFLTVHAALACAPPNAAECTGPADCAPAGDPMSDACPPYYPQLCLAGSCAAVAAEKIDVRADVALHFSLTGDVDSVTFAFVDPRPAGAGEDLDCADVGSGATTLNSSANVVTAGFVNFQTTSGTALFTDANFGSPPVGSYLLVVKGFSESHGRGQLVAAGCVANLNIQAPDPVTVTVQLSPAD